MSEWKSIQLGDHAEVLSGFPFPSEGFSQEEGVPLIRIRDLLAGELETYFIGPYPDDFVIDDGDILIGMDGDFNIVRWTKGKALLNQRVCKVFTSTTELDDAYLFWLLEPELQDIHQKTPQTTVKHLSVRDLAQLRLEVPPVNEQRLIARILDTLDTQIQKTEALIAKLEKVKEGLLHDLLTRGIDENGQLRPSPEQAPELYKESPLGLIPRVWDVGELGKKASITVGFVGTTSRFYTTEDNGVIFFRTGNITEHGLDSSDVKWVVSEFHKANPKSSLHSGDVVVSRVGYTGNAAVVPEVGEANCANMIIIRSRNALPDFIRLLFSSSLMIEQVAGFTVGSAQPVLNIGMVNRLICINPDLEEQKKIVREIDCITQRINLEIKSLEEKASLKTGLMDDLLTGRVRVTPLLDQAQATTPA